MVVEEDTVVIGGGNVAIDAGRVSRRAGSPNVTMVCLESREEMPALPEEIVEAEEDGVVMKPGWGPVSIRVNENGKVEGVEFTRCTSVFNSEHKFAPEFDESETMFVPAQRVIMSVGQAVFNKILVSYSAFSVAAQPSVALRDSAIRI